MAVVYWTIGFLAVCVVGFFGWAMTLPEEASASRSTVIEAPVDDVFALVTDVGNQSSWRSDVGGVKVSADGMSWVENTSQGIEISFREEQKQTGLYVISYTSPHGFTGHWEGRFIDESGATRIEIKETTHTRGLFAKAVGRIFAPAGAHIDLCLNDLSQALQSRTEDQSWQN